MSGTRALPVQPMMVKGEPVLSKHLPMIREEDDEGLVRMGPLLEHIENAPHQSIGLRDLLGIQAAQDVLLHGVHCSVGAIRPRWFPEPMRWLRPATPWCS